MREPKVLQRYREEREELENLNTEIPSLSETRRSRLTIKPLEPDSKQLRDLAKLCHTPRKKKPKPMFTAAGPGPQIRARRAKDYMRPSRHKKKR